MTVCTEKEPAAGNGGGLTLDDISVSLSYAQLQALTEQDKATLLDMARLLLADVRCFPHPGTSLDSSAPPLSHGGAGFE